jgi:hypothetical protein
MEVIARTWNTVVEKTDTVLRVRRRIPLNWHLVALSAATLTVLGRISPQHSGSLLHLVGLLSLYTFNSPYAMFLGRIRQVSHPERLVEVLSRDAPRRYRDVATTVFVVDGQRFDAPQVHSVGITHQPEIPGPRGRSAYYTVIIRLHPGRIVKLIRTAREQDAMQVAQRFASALGRPLTPIQTDSFDVFRVMRAGNIALIAFLLFVAVFCFIATIESRTRPLSFSGWIGSVAAVLLPPLVMLIPQVVIARRAFRLAAQMELERATSSALP